MSAICWNAKLPAVIVGNSLTTSVLFAFVIISTSPYHNYFPRSSCLSGRNVGGNVKVSWVCLSFHQASVDLSTSGHVSACKPLLWGLCQEGMSSTSLSWPQLSKNADSCYLCYSGLCNARELYIHECFFFVVFLKPVRCVSSLQKLVSWQMLT